MTSSRKNEQICPGCRRPWWAWDSGKKLCNQCDPPPPSVAKIVIRAIAAGEVRL